jgi:hypothetical protein
VGVGRQPRQQHDQRFVTGVLKIVQLEAVGSDESIHDVVTLSHC